MTFYELAKSRYSVRSYKEEIIKESELSAIIEAGRIAPTACNNQPQKIYIVRSEEKLSRLRDACRFTFNAPLVLAVGYDTERDWKNRRTPGCSSGETDAAIVLTHMMLAAHELGVGSCWVGAFSEDKVREALSIPEGIRITALMPLGYPADDAEPLDLHSVYREKSDTVETI